MGRNTIALTERLGISETHSSAAIRDAQLQSLRDLIRHAKKHCPYYWDLVLPDPDALRDIEDLRQVPFLTRTALRQHHHRMAWANPPRRLLLGHTHGTSDEPVRFIWDRTRQAWDKANRLRGHAWHGFEIGHRELHLWPIDPPRSLAERLKQRLRVHRDRLTAEAQIDSLALQNEQLSHDQAWAAWTAFAPARVTAYPSVLAEFIQANPDRCRESRPSSLRAIFLTGEVTHSWQQRLIETALGAPTVQSYGLSEAGAIAFACEYANWHVSAESAIVEIIRDGRTARPGELGEVVVTGLHSHAMPILRYCTGDIVRAEQARPCPCGRALPTMPPVLGRTADFLETAGRSWLAPEEAVSALADILPPGAFQIEQDARGDVQLSALESDGLPFGWQSRAINRMRELLGPLRLCDIRSVSRLRRSLFGKCRYVNSARTARSLAVPARA